MPRLMENTAVGYLILAHIIIGCGFAVTVLLSVMSKIATNRKRAALRRRRNG